MRHRHRIPNSLLALYSSGYSNLYSGDTREKLPRTRAACLDNTFYKMSDPAYRQNEREFFHTFIYISIILVVHYKAYYARAYALIRVFVNTQVRDMNYSRVFKVYARERIYV